MNLYLSIFTNKILFLPLLNSTYFSHSLPLPSTYILSTSSPVFLLWSNKMYEEGMASKTGKVSFFVIRIILRRASYLMF